MPRRMTVSLIGAGNLAGALARALSLAGYPIQHIVSRDRPASLQRARKLAARVNADPVPMHQFTARSELIWICTNDDAIGACAAQLAAKDLDWKGKVVLHSSGALSSEALQPLADLGAYAGSAHPMMTFVPGSEPSFHTVPMAVEGDAHAVRRARIIVSTIGASFYKIATEDKALYHAMGSFGSPLLVSLLVAAEQTGEAAGLARGTAKKFLYPIVQQTIRNYFQKGPAEAFSGPLARGDVETIRRHVESLRQHPELFRAYDALVRIALENLPVKEKGEIRSILELATGTNPSLASRDEDG